MKRIFWVGALLIALGALSGGCAEKGVASPTASAQVVEASPFATLIDTAAASLAATTEIAATPEVTQTLAPASPQPSLTLAPTPIPSQAAEVVDTPLPTPTVDCQADLRFISDVTVPDGTAVSPGQVIDKRWQVKNTGTCNWDERYRLQLVAGQELGAPKAQALVPALSGVKAIIRIVFTAPPDLGTYRSAWQAFDPQGEPFGDPIYIDILVVSPAPE